MATILYLTDFYYTANGRAYFEEDLYLTGRLKEHFDILIGHPQQALSYLHCAPLIVFRNTGPVMHYRAYFHRFVAEVSQRGITTFNSFDGKADRKGKDYLLQLTKEGYPVIPTVESISELEKLGNPAQYIIKLKEGADSIGMQVLHKEGLLQSNPANRLLQPFLPLLYEVSFYYLDNRLQYALYTPNKEQRWQLAEYEPSAADLDFADRFIQWNGMTRGIQRVDAGRLPDGSLLLIELEDLNPFLSIAVLSEEKREWFIQNLVAALQKAYTN